MNVRNDKKKWGFVLIMTLLILSIIGTLAVSFSCLSSQEYRIAKTEEWNIRTFYLARSGLEYYEVNRMFLTQGTKTRIEIEGREDKQYCDVEVTEDEVFSTGIIANNSGNKLFQKTLKAPQQSTHNWYETSK